MILRLTNISWSRFTTFFFVLLFFSISNTSSAQDCSQLVNTIFDEVTGVTLIRMKENLLISEAGEKKVAIFVAQKIDDQGIETALSIDCKDLGCISNGNAINILFTDGTREQYTNMSTFNCAGFALLFIDIPDYYGNTIRTTLLNKKIKVLRVSGNNSFIQVAFTQENQNHLVNVLKCLR